MVSQRLPLRERAGAVVKIFRYVMEAILITVMVAAFLCMILAMAWAMWGIVFVGVAIWEMTHDA